MSRAKRQILPFFIPHQGCPNQCIFCNQHSITGIGSGGMPIDFAEIERQLAALSPGRELMEIAFYGGSFSGLERETQRRLLEIALVQKERGTISHIRISTRPDYVDEERLLFLRQYGVDMIELGVQSLDDRVLMLSRRGHSCRQIYDGVKLVKQFGFQLIIQLLPGLPGDCYELAVAGAREVAAWHPDGVRIYPAVVLKDTPLYELYRGGRYAPLSIPEAVVWCRDMAVFFLRAGINILRVGLQPTDEIGWEGAVAAGAFHPAFGQLTQSAVALEQCKMLLSRGGAAAGCIAVPARELSAYIGQKRANVLALEGLYGEEIKILPEPFLAAGEIGLKKNPQESRYACHLSYQDFLEDYCRGIEGHLPLVKK